MTAIDIDDWCVNNSRDNIALNGISNITVALGDASLLKGHEPFDVIIANINRNILLQDMPAYAACMKKALNCISADSTRKTFRYCVKSGKSGYGIRTPPRKTQLGSRKI